MSERIPIQIYDDPDIASNNPVADLGEAKNIQYRKRRNEVWTASFDLPVDNEKNDHFDLLDFAEIYDGDKRVGLFRIDEREPVHSEDEEVIRYQCSHVLDTLNDDRLAIASKTTKTGTSTALSYIFDEQGTAHWQLGTLDFSQDYEYEFSRQTLLKALFDVPKPWWEDYRFTFDTTSYPWTINLITPDTTPKGSFRYSKNLQSIERTENAKDMINELYAFGEGSGDEQVSAGPFTSDPAGYGWNITDIWEEQFFDNQTDLANAAQRYLDRFDTPKVSYRGTAVDLRRLSKVNDFDLGDYIRIYDPILGIEDTVPVVEIAKNNVMGEPLRLEVELANRQRRFPEYGALAFKDEATEENLASGSVGGGAGGALAGGSVGETELAGEAVTWDKIKFKDASGDYMEQTRLKIDALVTFENNFTEIDKLDDGTTYAKMRKDWRSASDVTKIAGGEIYTDTIILDSIDFSPTTSKSIVGQINTHDDGLTIQGKTIELDGNTTVQGTFQVSQGNVIVDQDIDMGEGGGYNRILGCEQISGDSGVGIGLISNINLGNDTYMSAGYKLYLDAGQGMDTQGGPIAMGGGNINNPGTVDGVNISSHVNTEKAHQELLGGTDISITYGTGQVTIDFVGSTGAESLDDLNDTNIGFPSSGQYLGYDGSDWTNKTIDHSELDNIGTGDHIPSAWSEGSEFFVNAGDLGQEITVTDTSGIDRTFYMVKDAGTAIYYISH